MRGFFMRGYFATTQSPVLQGWIPTHCWLLKEGVGQQEAGPSRAGLFVFGGFQEKCSRARQSFKSSLHGIDIDGFRRCCRGSGRVRISRRALRACTAHQSSRWPRVVSPGKYPLSASALLRRRWLRAPSFEQDLLKAGTWLNISEKISFGEERDQIVMNRDSGIANLNEEQLAQAQAMAD